MGCLATSTSLPLTPSDTPGSRGSTPEAHAPAASTLAPPPTLDELLLLQHEQGSLFHSAAGLGCAGFWDAPGHPLGSGVYVCEAPVLVHSRWTALFSQLFPCAALSLFSLMTSLSGHTTMLLDLECQQPFPALGLNLPFVGLEGQDRWFLPSLTPDQ